MSYISINIDDCSNLCIVCSKNIPSVFIGIFSKDVAQDVIKAMHDEEFSITQNFLDDKETLKILQDIGEMFRNKKFDDFNNMRKHHEKLLVKIENEILQELDNKRKAQTQSSINSFPK